MAGQLKQRRNDTEKKVVVAKETKMSTTYHAHAIVGLKLPYSALLAKEMVRSCGHVHPGKTSDAPYCSQCGKAMWKEETRFRKEYDAGAETLGGIGVVTSQYRDFVFVCGMHCETKLDGDEDGVARFNHTSASEELVKERIRTAMSNLGLWDEKEFGKWVVMTAS